MSKRKKSRSRKRRVKGHIRRLKSGRRIRVKGYSRKTRRRKRRS